MAIKENAGHGFISNSKVVHKKRHRFYQEQNRQKQKQSYLKQV
tara:strand:+ start:488 stop:616 length:129 start_codon:yes stop_codon:yes gene_type:complete